MINLIKIILLICFLLVYSWIFSLSIINIADLEMEVFPLLNFIILILLLVFGLVIYLYYKLEIRRK